MGYITAEISPVLTAAGIVAVVSVLGYTGAPLWLWTVAAAGLLGGLGAPPWLWIAAGFVALVFNIIPLRRYLVSFPLMKAMLGSRLIPAISETERIALEAGSAWIETGFFSGKPDFKAILTESYPDLAEKERAFLDGPVEEVCRMTDDWEVHRRKDLSGAVWKFLKRDRFFGMIIPEEYDGLGFSAAAMNVVVGKLASRSVPLAVTVMVPNSLGPAELLIHYGTTEQKAHYLPKLARGEEIPCFALTEPEAGSDAASISSSGEVFEGDDGEIYIRLNWNKRYITLAAISTVLGLAFRLRDPANMLGKGEDPGITCGLIPTDIDGVVLGRRHDPVGVPFINCPTEGHDVVVSVNQIIGGPGQAGNGWKMLMETLAGGRGVFLPGMSTGGAKLTTRIAGAYAKVRQQFGLPIGRFEGVQELLAPIGGLTYMMEALSRFTCGALDKGTKPAVVSAIAKYHSSEFNRSIINHAMDILGGAGIVLGPRNALAHRYMAVPVAITVEGANVLTRSLIIFGQGLIRSHPYALEEIRALRSKNSNSFDKAIFGHVGLIIRNCFRCALLSLSRGYLAGSPVGGPTAKYYRRLSWSAATFSLMADIALLTLGGELKRKEELSGKFADILSWLYLATSALRRFEAEGRRKEDLPFIHWTQQYALFEIQKAMEGICENYPVPLLGILCRGPLALSLRINRIGRKPSDKLGRAVADAIQQAGDQRDMLTNGTYVPSDSDEPLAKLEYAFKLACESEVVFKRIRDAIKSGHLKRDENEAVIEEALGQGLISRQEQQLLAEAKRARAEAIRVDSFDLKDLPVQLPASGKTGLRKIFS